MKAEPLTKIGRAYLNHSCDYGVEENRDFILAIEEQARAIGRGDVAPLVQAGKSAIEAMSSEACDTDVDWAIDALRAALAEWEAHDDR